MAAAAAAAAGPAAGDPPVHLNSTADQEAWVNMDPFRYMDLCERAFQDGDFSYVQIALRANHLGLFELHQQSRDCWSAGSYQC